MGDHYGARLKRLNLLSNRIFATHRCEPIHSDHGCREVHILCPHGICCCVALPLFSLSHQRASTVSTVKTGFSALASSSRSCREVYSA